jgi:hypothetical protein
MTKTFRQQVLDRIKANADAAREQRDLEWHEWWNSGGSFEAIKYPELATPPSQRSAQQVLTIMQREIQRKREQDE